MWLLEDATGSYLLHSHHSISPRSDANNVIPYYLCAGHITLGRRDTDIIVSGTKSISRIHAIVTVGDLERSALQSMSTRQFIAVEVRLPLDVTIMPSLFFF